MKRYLFLLAAAILLPLSVFAQGTTSGSIEGTIVDSNGAPLAGANVVAIHQPTGTRYGTASRANGRYTIKSVRVGGPYVVQVTFVGFNPRKKEVTNVELGETVEVDFELEEGELALGEISVTAKADPVFNANRTGASTNISEQEIESTPTLSRSLSDFTRLNPQVTGGGSFGGANDRYNNILVDGATLNDVFGLGEGTPGSGAGVNSPISIGAIQEFNVDIAPFDVTNNGFTGGQVNAITKSGTNEFTGTAYYQLRNENFVGNFIDDQGDKSSDFSSFDEQYFGLSLGGPIVKDKLFFFTNIELKRRSSPITTGILNSGAPNTFDFPSSTFEEISNVASSQYNYDAGSFGDEITQDQDNNKILAKIDWNINDNHKFSLRYNYVDATDEEGIDRGSSSYSYSNRQYNFNSTQNSIVAELNSSFGNNASNTLRAVYTRIRDSRDVQAQPFPEVEISLPFPEKDDFGSFFMGIDRFSQANSLGQDLIEITDNFTYILGDHEFTVGTSNQFFSFDNKFVQDDFGSYVFRSIEDFRDGNPFQYRYSYLLPGGSPTANFSGIQLGFYAQDKWTFVDNLTLTFGLRTDIPILPDEPTRNPQVEESFPGYSTSNVASGNVLVSPRFGFNWDVTGDRTTQIRGGWGIFSGNPPFVWISNQYSNTGADYGRIDLRTFETDAFGPGFFSPDPNNQPSPLDQGSTIEGVSTSEVNLIEEDFQYPQSLKFNLAIDQELPFGIVGTLEGIYSKMMNEVKFRNINLEQQGTSINGRPIYGELFFNERFGNTSGAPNRVDPENFTNAIVLDNTSKGYQYSVTGELEKQFDSGFRASIAYTYNRAETINNGTSSRAISNWQFNENVDVNDPQLGTADFERRHRILGQVSYRFSWAERFATTVSFIYDGRSGGPFSWIYSGDANGDGRFDNDLIYVPESQDDIILADNNWNEFNNWIENNESLSDFRGGFVERGTAREPWSSFLDMRINQEIQTFSGQNIEITASLFNVLNFLNNEWGTQKSVNGFSNYQALKFQGYDDATGIPMVDFNPDNVSDEELYSINNLGSRWQLQLGVRYNF